MSNQKIQSAEAATTKHPEGVLAEVKSYVRPEVLAFAIEMENKLRENDGPKGGRRTWREAYATDLYGRLQAESGELLQAIVWLKNDPRAIRREAADVANFAMMIADTAGGGLELVEIEGIDRK